MKSTSIFIAATAASALLGCGKSGLDPADAAAVRARAEAAVAAGARERHERLIQDLKAITPENLSTLMRGCREAVMRDARERGKPFEPFIVDEYSADTYQAAAAVRNNGKPLPQAKRIEITVSEFMKARDAGEFSRLASIVDNGMDSFSVVVTSDSFNGPQRKVVNYSCSLRPGLKLEAEGR